LKNKYSIIKVIFSEEKEEQDFIEAEKQDGPIYESVKLLTYNDYSLRYNILYKKISHYYVVKILLIQNYQFFKICYIDH
jgi:hypothetical protein